jgi:hypothetical protein
LKPESSLVILSPHAHKGERWKKEGAVILSLLYLVKLHEQAIFSRSSAYTPATERLIPFED